MSGEDRFVRWQKALREQFGYAINLILTYSVAGLGFSLTLLKETTFAPHGSALTLYWVALGTMWLSIVLGIWCVVNRLYDFWGTSRRVRSLITGADTPSKESLRLVGKITWWLFGLQTSMFVIATTALGAVLLLEYVPRLVTR